MNKKGFTLVELIVTIAILGIITMIALPSVRSIQEKNTKTKYIQYGNTMKTSGKLYTDSYKEDMFGIASSGCIDVLFKDMLEKRLLKDIKINGDTCENDSSFVRVRKSNIGYTYEPYLKCTNKEGDTVYETEPPKEELCEAKEDGIAPEITIEGEKDSWNNPKNLKVYIKVSDDYGLIDNITLEYAWYKEGEDVSKLSYTKLSYGNKIGIKSAKLRVDSDKKFNGNYYLKVRPIKLMDVNGNSKVTSTISKVFLFDSTNPTCDWKENNTWKKETVTISSFCNDNLSGCKEKNKAFVYNEKNVEVSTDTNSWQIEDNAGNKTNCSSGTINVKYDSKGPTIPTKGDIGNVSGTTAAASISTKASGSSDGGSGLAGYRYLVTNTSEKPTDKSKFGTSLAYTRSCGTSYYAWVIAIDNVGNESGVKSLGNTEDAANNYSTWGSCSKSCGGGNQTRTNSCSLITSGLSQSCNVSSCKPAKPTITNPTFGKWTNQDFALKVNTTSSGIDYWQYSYNDSTWTTYSGSAKSSFTTTNFSKERNQAVYIRCCTSDNVCSDSESTNIKIDKTKPSCVSSGGNSAWTNGSRTLTGTCSDPVMSGNKSVAGSGCTGDASKSYTTDINTSEASPGTVYDKAGNSQSCPSNQTVKIDTIAPKAPWINLNYTVKLNGTTIKQNYYGNRASGSDNSINQSAWHDMCFVTSYSEPNTENNGTIECNEDKKNRKCYTMKRKNCGTWHVSYDSNDGGSPIGSLTSSEGKNDVELSSSKYCITDAAGNESCMTMSYINVFYIYTYNSTRADKIVLNGAYYKVSNYKYVKR